MSSVVNSVKEHSHPADLAVQPRSASLPAKVWDQASILPSEQSMFHSARQRMLLDPNRKRSPDQKDRGKPKRDRYFKCLVRVKASTTPRSCRNSRWIWPWRKIIREKEAGRLRMGLVRRARSAGVRYRIIGRKTMEQDRDEGQWCRARTRSRVRPYRAMTASHSQPRKRCLHGLIGRCWAETQTAPSNDWATCLEQLWPGRPDTARALLAALIINNDTRLYISV